MVSSIACMTCSAGHCSIVEAMIDRSYRMLPAVIRSYAVGNLVSPSAEIMLARGAFVAFDT